MTDDMPPKVSQQSTDSSYSVRPSTTSNYATNDQIESIEDFLSNIMTEHGGGGPSMDAQRAPSAYQARVGASSYQQPQQPVGRGGYGSAPAQQQSGYGGAAPRGPSAYQPAPQQGGYGSAPAQQQGGYGSAPAQQQGGYGSAAPRGPSAYQPAPQQGGYGGGAGSYNAPYGGAGDDGAELAQQGFQRHNNRGKWIKSGQGKASDFRIRGTTSSKEGLAHAITVRPLDDYGNPAPLDLPYDVIGVILTHRQSGQNIQAWMRDNGDATYDIGFFAGHAGIVRMEIKICNHPMFDIDIQIDGSDTSLWVAQPRLPADIGRPFVIDIVSADGSRPDGVAPFEVKAMGDCTELKLLNNGDGTYMFTCVPQSAGHLTIQIMLHDQPIQDSPVSVQVGAKQTHYIRQVAEPPAQASRAGPGGGIPANVGYSAPAPAPAVGGYDRNSYYGGAPAGAAYDDGYTAEPHYAASGAYDAQDYGAYGADAGYDAQDFGQPAYGGQESYGYDQGYGGGQEVTNDDLNRLLDELGSGL